ncbi:MAG: hypothetical protein Q9222_003755 [Ikaeria aurantiellina]
MTPSKTIKTRFCIISDTHTAPLFPPNDTNHAYRSPLPSADVLLHAGDITNSGYIVEYEAMFEMIANADAELKIVIAGNHDITLDKQYYEITGCKLMHCNRPEDLQEVKDIWTGEKAKKAGIVYLEEGISTFTLKNGARFTLCNTPDLHLPLPTRILQLGLPLRTPRRPLQPFPYLPARKPYPRFPCHRHPPHPRPPSRHPRQNNHLPARRRRAPPPRRKALSSTPALFRPHTRGMGR